MILGIYLSGESLPFKPVFQRGCQLFLLATRQDYNPTQIRPSLGLGARTICLYSLKKEKRKILGIELEKTITVLYKIIYIYSEEIRQVIKEDRFKIVQYFISQKHL
jgi:hypothetical protein